MKTRWFATVVCGVVFVLFQAAMALSVYGSNGESREAIIQVKEGLLTVSVKEMPLIQVLNKLADQTGMGYEINYDADRPVTIAFSNIPLEQGIKRLLKPASYIIVYGQKEGVADPSSIRRILVYGHSGKSAGLKTRKGARLVVGKKKPIAGAAVKPAQEARENSFSDYTKKLTDHDPDVREEAVMDMADEYSEASLEHLGSVLTDDTHTDVREAAAEAIGEMESEKGIGILAKGLRDSHADVREAVVDALGEIGGRKVLSLLKSALKDANEDVREAAADLLEEFEEEGAE